MSHPHILAGGTKIRVDGTGWYLNERKAKGHGVTWPLIIFTHATQISSVKGLRLNPFFRIAQAYGWLRPSWYWTGIGAGFELWKGSRGLRVTDFRVDS